MPTDLARKIENNKKIGGCLFFPSLEEELQPQIAEYFGNL
jgi:hypothetical protein